MSKISNTTAYPTVTPAAGDLLVITDVSDSNATKTATVSSFTSSVLGLQTQEITLTPAQLLSLDGGGTIELIEAPGAGKVIVPISFACFLDFNTIAYDLSSDINIKSGTTGGSFGAVDADELNSSSDVYFTVTLSPYPGATLEVNGALNIVATTQTITQGDSPLTLSITYRIVDFS